MKIGDIVYLKSGSPPLTIRRIGNLFNEIIEITVCCFNEAGSPEEMTASLECFQTEVPAFNLGVP